VVRLGVDNNKSKSSHNVTIEKRGSVFAVHTHRRKKSQACQESLLKTRRGALSIFTDSLVLLSAAIEVSISIHSPTLEADHSQVNAYIVSIYDCTVLAHSIRSSKEKQESRHADCS
jgi:hypothetical protein